MMDEKKISQKTLNKSFNLWFWGALTCFSQEQMQTFGYLASMLPIIKELYPDKKKQLDNIYPGLLTVIVTFLCWWLMAKKHVSAIWTMIILIGVAFLGVLVGFFNPGLSY